MCFTADTHPDTDGALGLHAELVSNTTLHCPLYQVSKFGANVAVPPATLRGQCWAALPPSSSETRKTQRRKTRRAFWGKIVWVGDELQTSSGTQGQTRATGQLDGDRTGCELWQRTSGAKESVGAPSSGVYGQRREQRLVVLHLFLYIKESERHMKQVYH